MGRAAAVHALPLSFDALLLYLLSGDDIPECGTCHCPLTVKHILMECVDFNDVRNKHFVISSIKRLI